MSIDPTMHIATALDASADSSWRVSREGSVIAAIDIRQEAGDVVVAGPTEGAKPKPYRFPTLQAADVFLTDLMTSFAYLGCEVART